MKRRSTAASIVIGSTNVTDGTLKPVDLQSSGLADGHFLQYDAGNATFKWSQVEIKNYTAGSGLALTGTTISVRPGQTTWRWW